MGRVIFIFIPLLFCQLPLIEKGFQETLKSKIQHYPAIKHLLFMEFSSFSAHP